MEASQERRGILQEVGDHSGPQAVPPLRQQTKKTTENSNDGHQTGALVTMPGAEDDGLQEESGGGAAGPGGELSLKIAAENDFLAETGGCAEKEIHGNF